MDFSWQVIPGYCLVFVFVFVILVIFWECCSNRIWSGRGHQGRGAWHCRGREGYGRWEKRVGSRYAKVAETERKRKKKKRAEAGSKRCEKREVPRPLVLHPRALEDTPDFRNDFNLDMLFLKQRIFELSPLMEEFLKVQ